MDEDIHFANTRAKGHEGIGFVYCLTTRLAFPQERRELQRGGKATRQNGGIKSFFPCKSLSSPQCLIQSYYYRRPLESRFKQSMYEQVHEASQRAPDRLRETTSTVLLSIFHLRAWGVEFDLAVTFLYTILLLVFGSLFHLESVTVISMALVRREEKHTGGATPLGSLRCWHHPPFACRKHRSIRTAHQSEGQ